jgi:hypothetical protein
MGWAAGVADHGKRKKITNLQSKKIVLSDLGIIGDRGLGDLSQGNQASIPICQLAKGVSGAGVPSHGGQQLNSLQLNSTQLNSTQPNFCKKRPNSTQLQGRVELAS